MRREGHRDAALRMREGTARGDGEGTGLKRVEDAALCAGCGGLCCLHAPGNYAPHDLDAFGGVCTDAVSRMLDAGQAAINASLVAVYWLPVVPLLTLGARGIGKQALCLCCGDRRCVHLGAKGCALALDERPFECAVMVPHADRRLCRMPGDTSMEELWLEHQGILREAVELRTGRPWRDELMRQLIRAPVDDAFANGARELIDTLGFASDDASIRETVAAWKTEGVHGGPADG